MEEKRPVVTGLGLINAVGRSVPGAMEALGGGPQPAGAQPSIEILQTPAGPVAALGVGALPVPELLARPWRRMSRAARLGWYATRQALDQSARSTAGSWPDGECMDLVLGTSRGPAFCRERLVTDVAGGRRPRPSQISNAVLAGVPGSIAAACGLQGGVLAVSAACVSGSVAVGVAYEKIRAVSASFIVAAGVDSPLRGSTAAEFAALGVVATSHGNAGPRCRPYHPERDGLLLGEGAAALVLEDAACAAERGAPILGRVLGFGHTADPGQGSATSNSVAGVVRAIEKAMATSGLGPEDIGFIMGHGSGTPLGDRIETEAYASVFGSLLAETPLLATKAVTGHCLGATSAIEVILALATLRVGRVPSLPYEAMQDPDLPKLCLSGEARNLSQRTCLTLSLGFWGQCSALVLSA